MTFQLRGAVLAALAALAFATPALAAASADDSTPATVDVAALDPAKLKVAREIVDLAFPPDQRAEAFSGMLNAVLAQVKAIRPKLGQSDPEQSAFLNREIDDLTDELTGMLVKHIPEFMDGVAQAYASEFTMQELEDVRSFVSTPSGQAYFQRSMKLVANPYYVAATQPYMHDVQAMSRDWVAKLQSDLIAFEKQRQSGK